MTERPAKSNIDSAWLASALSVLLASPHAASPDASPPLPNLGPPPDDVFSTKFDELFAPDADGFVWRHRIDRATLKDTLLGLHSRWNAVEGTCSGCDVHETQFEEFHVSPPSCCRGIEANGSCQPTMAVQIEFTPLYRYPREKGTVMALARYVGDPEFCSVL